MGSLHPKMKPHEDTTKRAVLEVSTDSKTIFVKTCRNSESKRHQGRAVFSAPRPGPLKRLCSALNKPPADEYLLSVTGISCPSTAVRQANPSTKASSSPGGGGGQQNLTLTGVRAPLAAPQARGCPVEMISFLRRGLVQTRRLPHLTGPSPAMNLGQSVLLADNQGRCQWGNRWSGGQHQK